VHFKMLKRPKALNDFLLTILIQSRKFQGQTVTQSIWKISLYNSSSKFCKLTTFPTVTNTNTCWLFELHILKKFLSINSNRGVQSKLLGGLQFQLFHKNLYIFGSFSIENWRENGQNIDIYSNFELLTFSRRLDTPD
jgi:hypothetical protein